MVVSGAAVAYAGPDLLSNNSDDVFAPIGKAVLGDGLDKLADHRGAHVGVGVHADDHPADREDEPLDGPRRRDAEDLRTNPSRASRRRTSRPSPWAAISIIWYVGLTLVSTDVLGDSIAALGLMIAFYYGITGYACAIYYRRELRKSWRNFVYIGVLPVGGAIILTWVFIKSCIDLSKADAGSLVVFGLGGPFVIGIAGLLLGVVFMFLWQGRHPAFFRRKLEVADPALLERAHPAATDGGS